MIIIRLENVSRETLDLEAIPRPNSVKRYYEEPNGEIQLKIEVKDGEDVVSATRRLFTHLAKMDRCITSPKANEL